MASTTRLFGFLLCSAVALAIGACAEPKVTVCGNTGVICPEGTHCAAAQGISIDDVQKCGNATKDTGEACDDGNTLDGDGCSRDCLSDETCGNGKVDTTVGEVCEPPNGKDANGKLICSADCRSNESCGNGTIDLEVGEICDDGNRVDG